MLAGILEKLPAMPCPDLLVGMETMDDAGVLRLTDDMALVQTVDFFYPVVNDARAFGRIVAANSLSDLWAMGARALTAMNLLSYPAGKIEPDVIEQLLTGASEKLVEAGVVLVGGHTMEQESMVYGMSVSGLVHPDSVTTNSRARVGDVLVLTKPLGTGVYANAHKADGLTPEQYRSFVDSMERLNLYAAGVLTRFDVSAVTDVTGFGLLGHALPMAQHANITLRIQAGQVPHFDQIESLMERYNPRGVCKCNVYIKPHTTFADEVTDSTRSLLQEAQTSGGLMFLVHPDQAETVCQEIRQAGDVDTTIIGRAMDLERDAQGQPIYLEVIA